MRGVKFKVKIEDNILGIYPVQTIAAVDVLETLSIDLGFNDDGDYMQQLRIKPGDVRDRLEALAKSRKIPIPDNLSQIQWT